MSNTVTKVTGSSFPPDQFKCVEDWTSVNYETVFAILTGKLSVYVVRNAIAAEDCFRIRSNFWNRVGNSQRGDGPMAYVLGAYHYGKSTDQYFKDLTQNKMQPDSVFDGVRDPVSELYKGLQTHCLKRNIDCRPAMFQGQAAGTSRAMSWMKPGDFLLEPHDDVGQLSNPKQRDFEIQLVAKRAVMAVNAYPSASPKEGQLKIWNILPDDAARARLGITETGFPYSPDVLNGFASMTIPLCTGDVCVFNGGQVHAVQGADYTETRFRDRRLLLTSFAGFINDTTLVWWT